MATEWYMEGPWFKNCNCDPGCPCDFNANPTHGHCDGMVAMRVDSGYFGDVDLTGVKWGAVVHWDGALHEGGGQIQPFIDESASETQRDAVFQVMSGQHGDSMMEVISVVAPNIHEPIFAPVEFEFDLETRHGRVTVGDVLHAEVETLRGINPPDPYRVVVRIPDGMEYTNEAGEAETALAKRISARGAVQFEVEDGHSSMCFVRRGNAYRTGKHEPTVVSA